MDRNHAMAFTWSNVAGVGSEEKSFPTDLRARPGGHGQLALGRPGLPVQGRCGPGSGRWPEGRRADFLLFGMVALVRGDLTVEDHPGI